MATIDRFKDVINSGKISAGDVDVPLSAPAIHTMEQIENLASEIASRKKYRAELREKLLRNCRQSMKKFGEDQDELTLKQLEAAIKMLTECRNEIVKLDTASKESDKLAKLIRDGVSAGH